MVSLPAAGILKLGGAASVLWIDAFVFLGAAVAGYRLPTIGNRSAT